MTKGLSRVNQLKFREHFFNKAKILIDAENEFIDDEALEVPQDLIDWIIFNDKKMLYMPRSSGTRIHANAAPTGIELIELYTGEYKLNTSKQNSFLDVDESFGGIRRLAMLDIELSELAKERFGSVTTGELKEDKSDIFFYFDSHIELDGTWEITGARQTLNDQEKVQLDGQTSNYYATPSLPIDFSKPVFGFWVTTASGEFDNNLLLVEEGGSVSLELLNLTESSGIITLTTDGFIDTTSASFDGSGDLIELPESIAVVIDIDVDELRIYFNADPSNPAIIFYGISGYVDYFSSDVRIAAKQGVFTKTFDTPEGASMFDLFGIEPKLPLATLGWKLAMAYEGGPLDTSLQLGRFNFDGELEAAHLVSSVMALGTEKRVAIGINTNINHYYLYLNMAKNEDQSSEPDPIGAPFDINSAATFFVLMSSNNSYAVSEKHNTASLQSPFSQQSAAYSFGEPVSFIVVLDIERNKIELYSQEMPELILAQVDFDFTEYGSLDRIYATISLQQMGQEKGILDFGTTFNAPDSTPIFGTTTAPQEVLEEEE